MRRPMIGVTGFQEIWRIDCGDYLTAAVESHYNELVEEAGGLPMLVGTSAAGADDVVERVDALLITGGPDVDPLIYGHERHPRTGDADHRRDALEVALVKSAMRRRMPVLGICRGCQLVAAALGGSLEQHVDGHFLLDRPEDKVHEVEVVAGSRLAGVIGPGHHGVNSLHHQAVADPGPHLVISARAAGIDLIEGVEHPSAPVLAVQWHPEKMGDLTLARHLFTWLVSEASQFAATRTS